MSNASYENLHKLVDYVLKHHIMEVKDLAKLFNLSLTEFYAEFIDGD